MSPRQFTQADLDFAAFLAATTAVSRRAGGGAFLRRNEFTTSPRVTTTRQYDLETERLRARIHHDERKTA
ncbi:hypothetical protein [Agromyces sp. NPDC058064]|uniref:hypothetical protein n=1 Tax=Agromyces sp. NPDC058064 TaxID=3346322 RepID=UPI0036D90797